MVPFHVYSNARTSLQPDMMWRTNAVEGEQLTQGQQSVWIQGFLEK